MIYFIIALLATSVGSLVGLGGDILIIPFLLSLGVPKALISVNVDISMFAMSLMATIIYGRRRQGDFKTAILFAIGIIPGASFGVFINSKITIPTFKLVFIALVILLLIIMLIKDKLPKVVLPNYTKPIVGICIGIISGLFGIGGALLLVPILIIFYGLCTKKTAATTMYLVFISTIVTVSNYLFRGYTDLSYAAWMVPGAILGSAIGTYFNKKVSHKFIDITFKLILVFIIVKQLFAMFIH
ncbi:MAG: sulfite exporter TauE/SafE family protein [Sarcina sp.]